MATRSEYMAPPAPKTLRATGSVARRQAVSRFSRYVLLLATLSGVAVLVYLGYETIATGWDRLSWSFLTSYPSRFAEKAGLRSSILGSAWLLGTTVVLAIPIAIGAAVWMEEFAPKNRLLTIVKLNLANLAGVPSIIYGILGLAVFVRLLGLGSSILAGALTLTLMILPMTVIASQEAIRQVPRSIREGALALGATRWQTVRYHVLPGAMPGIITGLILAVSRAAGETAALIMIGAFTFIAFDNTGLTPTDSPPFITPPPLGDDFTTVPVQIYNWTIRPQEAFRENAAAAIIVLMVAILGLNLVAAVIREKFRRQY
jgi:phosphate transport system permease protein